MKSLAILLFHCLAFGSDTKWILVWADNFNGPANSRPDPSKWTFDLGATGWEIMSWRITPTAGKTYFWMVTVTW